MTLTGGWGRCCAELKFYLPDKDFGLWFIKVCSSFAYAAEVCLNAHEWVKRQLAKKGIAFDALDNRVLSCEIPALATTL